MKKEMYIRVWQKNDILYIKEHLLIAGSTGGDCAKCKEIGLPITSTKKCPKCGTEFKFLSSRIVSNPAQASRLINKRPDLVFIEHSDYKASAARNQALDFLRD